jgi:creatinine amidohydrolase
MFPDELEAAFVRRPVLYLPYGLCEPHGPHSALGLDGLKAHAICVKAAQQTGGIVAPPDFWHVHELGYYAVWAERRIGNVARKWLTAIPPWLHFKNICYHVRAAEQIGFQAIILFTGHYGPNYHDLKTLVDLLQPRVAARLHGMPEFEANTTGFDGDGKFRDHAGKVETSLLWSLAPECIDVDRLPAPASGAESHFGMGSDAHLADREVGDKMVAAEIACLTAIGDRLLASFAASAFPDGTRRLCTFDDVEEFWHTTVLPVLDTFQSMADYVTPSKDVEAIATSSVWKAGSARALRAR